MNKVMNSIRRIASCTDPRGTVDVNFVDCDSGCRLIPLFRKCLVILELNIAVICGAGPSLFGEILSSGNSCRGSVQPAFGRFSVWAAIIDSVI